MPKIPKSLFRNILLQTSNYIHFRSHSLWVFSLEKWNVCQGRLHDKTTFHGEKPWKISLFGRIIKLLRLTHIYFSCCVSLLRIKWVLMGGTFDKILMCLWLSSLPLILCIINAIILLGKGQTTGLFMLGYGSYTLTHPPGYTQEILGKHSGLSNIFINWAGDI